MMPSWSDKCAVDRVVVDFVGEAYEASRDGPSSCWTGITFLWNSVERSPGPPEVVGRCSMSGSGVSIVLSARVTGVAAFNRSIVGCGSVSSACRWWVSLSPPLSMRNDLDLASILAMAVSRLRLVGVSTQLGL